jgi:hypothetical protein
MSLGSHPTEPFVMDDLGERLAGLQRVEASVFGAGILLAEGEDDPDQPLGRHPEDILGRLPALAVEPAYCGIGI